MVKKEEINYNDVIRAAKKLINSRTLYNKEEYQSCINSLEELRAKTEENSKRYSEILRKEGALYTHLWHKGVKGAKEKEVESYSLAIESNEAIGRERNNAELYRILGRAYMSAGNYGEAEKCFEEGKKLSEEYGMPRKKKLFEELIKDTGKTEGIIYRRARAGKVKRKVRVKK